MTDETRGLVTMLAEALHEDVCAPIVGAGAMLTHQATDAGAPCFAHSARLVGMMPLLFQFVQSYVAIGIASLPNGGGVTHKQALVVGGNVAKMVLS